MTISEIRQKFKDFFEDRQHAILDSAPLITKDEKGVTDSTLFNTAGVQPLIRYLLGEDHPAGTRLASSQACIRTIDIDEVGDNTHLTFFEMLGNWSLGDYFKDESIQWSYEFLTTPPEDGGLGLDPNRLYITVFEGDQNASRDDEAAEIWKKYVPENRIYFMGAESNWWAAGDNGPCGPDTEMFYDTTEEGLGDMTHTEFVEADESQKVVEIWNNVFMQYEKSAGEIVGTLPKPSVDTGAGLERLAAVVNNDPDVYGNDVLSELLNLIKNNSNTSNDSDAKIIADHIRAVTFMLSESLEPSNTDRGYILRRLIRRAAQKSNKIDLKDGILLKLVEIVAEKYSDSYPSIQNNIDKIKNSLNIELEKFQKTLVSGLKEFEKIIKKSNTKEISGFDAFKLFSTYGFPIELTIELAEEKGLSVDLAKYHDELSQHQEKSRTASAGKFKGGLEAQGEIEIKYHTATHLLAAALRQVLGDHVQQKGSNINSDRLRFDFSHSEKMTPEQKDAVEKIVNEKITAALPVIKEEMSYKDAKDSGAIGVFEDKYGDVVSVYTIGAGSDEFSKELCGGPHVENTSELGIFKIKKEEASSAGVRRIKAILE